MSSRSPCSPSPCTAGCAITLLLAALYAGQLVPYYGCVNPPTGRALLVDPAVGALITTSVSAGGMFVRARRQLVLSLRDRAVGRRRSRQLRAEQARAPGARPDRPGDARRARPPALAAELHAGALEFRPDAPPEEVARAAGVIRESAHEALEDLREVIGVLRDGDPAGDADRPQPTLADLPALVEESRAAGTGCAATTELDDPAAVPATVGRTAYRIVQEGLTNARKHAPGAVVDRAARAAARATA